MTALNTVKGGPRMAPIPPDIDGLSAWAYEQGTDPLDWGIACAETAITAHLHVCVGRAVDPASFPGYSRDLSVEALARRIIGNLIDAGWRIPGDSGTPTPGELLEPRE
jgi:hypothetical protein